MTKVRMLLATTLALSGLAHASDEPVEFYFANDLVLQQVAAGKDPAEAQLAATAEFTRHCLAGAQLAMLAEGYKPDPAMPLEERKAQAAKFDSTRFEQIARAGWARAQAALPQQPVHVCVDVARSDDGFTRDRMGGLMAVTAGSGRIAIKVHPDADWAKLLPYLMAHELHHSYWIQQHFDPARPFTLADYLVLEGRADYFASQLQAHPAPWIHALDDAGHATAWKNFSPLLDATDQPTLMGAMFGNPNAGIPMWAGYSIGYRLVSERMAKEPTLDFAAMTAAPASEFMPDAVSKPE